jgi:hypothetical protein
MLRVSSSLPIGLSLDEMISDIVLRQGSSRLSRCLRIVIAKHSPKRVLEGGLPIEALEKNHGKDNDAAQ